jgi:3-hydroxyacyl-CoA dehydrogenase
MPLVEVIHDARTEPEARAGGARLRAAHRQAAAAVCSAPGFLVNRDPVPYLVEAMLAPRRKACRWP